MQPLKAYAVAASAATQRLALAVLNPKLDNRRFAPGSTVSSPRRFPGRKTSRFLAIAAVSLSVSGCIFNTVATRDHANFENYTFRQTAGLGFCSNPDSVFSAEISRKADGSMTFAHTMLAPDGNDPSQCEDGVANDTACFRPKAQPDRTLNRQEAERVTSVFSSVDYFSRPDPLCRELAVDPCVIERHAWDGRELSDYFCGSDRLSDDQAREIRALLADLKAGN